MSRTVRRLAAENSHIPAAARGAASARRTRPLRNQRTELAVNRL